MIHDHDVMKWVMSLIISCPYSEWRIVDCKSLDSSNISNNSILIISNPKKIHHFSIYPTIWFSLFPGTQKNPSPQFPHLGDLHDAGRSFHLCQGFGTLLNDLKTRDQGQTTDEWKWKNLHLSNIEKTLTRSGTRISRFKFKAAKSGFEKKEWFESHTDTIASLRSSCEGNEVRWWCV